MSDNLPIDALIEILSRLPVKSLVRFTCICKQWYSLITNPNFISTHLKKTLLKSNNNNNNNSNNNNNNDDDQLLLVRHYNMFDETELFALYLDNESFDKYVELECPFRSVKEYFRIVGSCNGLICLSDDYDTFTDTIIIWNPSVRRSVTLPKPQFPYTSQGACLMGFGCDAFNNDYKVVRIVYQYNSPDDHNYRVPPNVEVYSLSTGTWRNLGVAAPTYIVYNFFALPAFVNGAVHWVASDRGDKGSFHNLVAAFDMRDEVFRDIMMPDGVAKTEVLKLSISVLGTSLALVQYEKIWQSEYCWVWMMEEYGVAESWTRLFTIDMREGIRKVVGFQRNNEVLLSARVRGLISYAPNTQRTVYLGIHGTNRSFYVDNYVESLVLLKGNRALYAANSCDDGEGESCVHAEEDGTEKQQ